MKELTDDEKSGLSAEELAALEGNEDSMDTLAEIAGEDGDESDEGNGTDDAAADADAPKDAAKGDGAEDDAEDDDDGFTPKLHVQNVEKFDEIIQQIAEQRKTLDEQFEAGDIVLSAYMSQRDALSGQEADLKVERATAKFAQEQNAASLTQRWDWEQEQFLDDHKEYAEDPILYAALDASVKALANVPENVNRSGRWFLNQAHKQVTERFVRKSETPPVVDGGAKPRQKPDLSVVPKTLGGLPAAEGNETGQSEFDALDKLTGMELEEALARLTPTQQSRYLTS